MSHEYDGWVTLATGGLILTNLRGSPLGIRRAEFYLYSLLAGSAAIPPGYRLRFKSPGNIAEPTLGEPTLVYGEDVDCLRPEFVKLIDSENQDKGDEDKRGEGTDDKDEGNRVTVDLDDIGCRQRGRPEDSSPYASDDVLVEEVIQVMREQGTSAWDAVLAVKAGERAEGPAKIDSKRTRIHKKVMAKARAIIRG